MKNLKLKDDEFDVLSAALDFALNANGFDCDEDQDKALLLQIKLEESR